MSLFEWDDAKAKQNRLKHGIGFDDAAQALLGLAYTRESPRRGETRMASICVCAARLIVVIWTPRNGAIRIISARSARTHEQSDYHQAVGGAAKARDN